MVGPLTRWFMDVLLLALVGVFLLAGAVTLGIGHKGWSWGTVVAAWLVLLSATGFLYLAARIAERERVWRSVIVRQQADVTRLRDAMVPGDDGLVPDGEQLPLETLAVQKARWRRALDAVDTWRDRHWDKAGFQPPRDGKPGTITIEVENDSVTAPPINPGAEVAVFDTTAIEEGGRFLGIFRVEQSATNKEQMKHSLAVVPAIPPDEGDAKLWEKDYEAVAVYEDLPVDRWLAFYRAKKEGDDPAADAPVPEVLPTDPEALLKGLQTLEEFQRHKAAALPEEEWKKLAQVWDDWKKAAGDEAVEAAKEAKDQALPPGRYWAEVEFKEPKAFAAAGGEPREFESGQTGTFDLETALELAAESVVDIKGVFYRRPLSDAFTALRGGDVEGLDAERKPTSVRTDGLLAIRDVLRSGIAAIEADIARLKASRTAADAQMGSLAKSREELEQDRAQWQQDIDAATRVADAFARRLELIDEELTTATRDTVRLGRELGEAVARLTTEIDRQAPAPARAATPGAAAPIR